MKRAISIHLVVACLLAAASGSVGAQSDQRAADGVFTGELKIVLYVRDVERSAVFYRDVLGFEFHGFATAGGGDPYYAEFSAASTKFGLHEPVAPDQVDRVGKARVYFRVRDLQAQRSRVLDRGAAAGAIKKTGWMDMFIVPDPDGNEVVFAVTDAAKHAIDPWHADASGQPE